METLKGIIVSLFLVGILFASDSQAAVPGGKNVSKQKKVRVQDEFVEDEEFLDEAAENEEFLEPDSDAAAAPSSGSDEEELTLDDAPAETAQPEVKGDDSVLEQEGQAASPPAAPAANQAEKQIKPSTPKVEAGGEDLKSFIASTETKIFRGSPVTIRLRDAPIVDVLQMIADASGFNIILTRGVTGTITLNLVDVPWDQALDEILRVNNLGAERNNNILRIMTLSELEASKVAERTARQAALSVAPRLTRVFRVSYAELASLQTIVGSFITPVTGDNSPVIQTDTRTNSLIVRATAEELSRIEKVIEVLDTQTPQVLIEAKIVEASETFSRSLGGSLGISTSGTTFYGASFQGAQVTDQLLGEDLSSGSSPFGGAFGFSPAISGIDRINAFLSLAESEDQVEIVASPKIVVLDRQAANLTQTTPGINLITVSDQGISTTTPTTVSADLSLNVTPTVTNDESVLLNLNLTRGLPRVLGSNTAIANRNFQTQVIVENGTTLVVGGVFSIDERSGNSGFPVLKDLPILGYLFSSQTKSIEKTELFAFVTPTIVNTGRAGFETGQ